MKFLLCPPQAQVTVAFLGKVEYDDALVVIHAAKVVIIFLRLITDNDTDTCIPPALSAENPV